MNGCAKSWGIYLFFKKENPQNMFTWLEHAEKCLE